MWGMIIQPELVTASVGGVNALSLLGVGLVGLIWLAVGLLAWMAALDIGLKHHSCNYGALAQRVACGLDEETTPRVLGFIRVVRFAEAERGQ